MARKRDRSGAAPPKRSPRRAGAVLVPLTVEEREQMRAKATAEGRPLAQWIRWVCLREAQRSSTPARPPT